MTTMRTLLLIITLSVGVNAAATPAKITRVALPEVVVNGPVPSRVLAAFNQALPSELRKLEGISVVTATEIRELLGLERQKQLLGCDEDTSCMAEVAGALDADEMVGFEIALVNEKYTVSWRRMDVRKARTVQGETRRFEQKDGEELLAMVGESVKAMYSDRALKPGRVRGVAPEVARKLNPPPLPKWIAYTGGAAAILAGLGGGGFQLLSQEAASEYRTLANRSLNEPVSAVELKGLEQKAIARARTGNILLITAGGLALATGVAAIFTDWNDDRAALTVTPMASLDGAGVGVSGNF